MTRPHETTGTTLLSRGNALKECWKKHPLLLMEGALSERLKQEFHLPTEGPAGMTGLVRRPDARSALGLLWRQYLAVAERYGMPFLATTPTRRFDRARAKQAGYVDTDGACTLADENMAMLRAVRDDADRRGVPMFAGALLGCRGDAYTAEGCLSAEDSATFHLWEATLFARAGADFLYAALMPALPESLGMARAMAQSGLPFLMSFTLRADGRLVDGTPLYEAVDIIDAEVSPRPLCFMAGCVHPAVVMQALSLPMNRTESVRTRFLGIQANAANLPFHALEHSESIRQSTPEELAQDMKTLKERFGLRLFGGCCGTTDRHMEVMAAGLTGRSLNA